MKIVSGKTGTSHVTSEQFRQIIEGTVGQGSYILTSGENLEPELASNNMLKIRGGMMSHHGNVSCVELNTYDEVTLTNGSQGVRRIDLIVNRYTRNDETGLEKNEWVVIIGTPDATNPKVPEYITGNLQNGDLTDDCPVFEVHYDGINVTEVKKLLPVMSNLDLLNGKLTKRKLVEVRFPKGSYIGTAYIEDLKTTDIVIAQRKRYVNSSNVSAIIAAYCTEDGLLSLTTDIPSTFEDLIMSAYVLYGSTCN